MAKLNDDIRYLKGIGEQRANSLAKLGITNLRELISYFPRTYEDRSHYVPIAALSDGDTACVRAMVANEPTLSRVRRGMDQPDVALFQSGRDAGERGKADYLPEAV